MSTTGRRPAKRPEEPAARGGRRAAVRAPQRPVARPDADRSTSCTIDRANVAAVRRRHRPALRRPRAADISVRADLPGGDVACYRVRLSFPRNGFRSHRKPHHPVPADQVTDTVDIQVHAENLREHRRGLLVDLVTDVSVGNERGLAPGDDLSASAAHQLVRRAQAAAAEAAQVAAAQRSCGSAPARFAATPPSVATTTRSTPTRRGQAVRIPHRHRARNVQRSSGIGEP